MTSARVIAIIIKEDYFKKVIVNENDCIDVDNFCSNLAVAGYKRVFTVEGIGQYSRRGSIIDVFCPLYNLTL